MDERVLIISCECDLNFFISFQTKYSDLGLRTETKTEAKTKAQPNVSTRSSMASQENVMGPSAPPHSREGSSMCYTVRLTTYLTRPYKFLY